MELFKKGKFQFNVAEALKSGLYVSGTTGCGKSDIAMYCLDKLREKGVISVIFDPSQDWVDRYPASVVTPSNTPNRPFAQIVLTGATVVDISMCTIEQTKLLVEKFSEQLFLQQARQPKEKRQTYFVLFEEGQTEFPQGALRAKAMQNVVRLATQGRNYKIRVGVVTQFAAMLDKDIMKFMNQRYFGWTAEPNDVDYIGEMLGDDEVAENLKYFDSGDFLYWYPAKNILEQIHINPYGDKS